MSETENTQFESVTNVDDGKRGLNYCFTINNYTDDHERLLKEYYDAGNCECICYGREIAPTTNTPHLQGFIVFKTVKSFKQVCALKQFEWHISRMIKPVLANYRYCTKDGNHVLYGKAPITSKKEQGEMGKEKGKSSRRTDIDEMIKDIESGMSRQDLLRKHSKFAMQYTKGFETYYNEFKPSLKYDITADPKVTLYPWQSKVIEYIKQPIDDRKILWIWDSVGNVGKTSMSRHLLSNGFLRLENGTSANISYIWNGENVVFDYSRSQQEHINYGIMESIKNGMVMSSKYEGISKVYSPPHVIVFANWPPKVGVMSEDRFDIHEIDYDSKDYAVTHVHNELGVRVKKSVKVSKQIIVN